MCTVAIAAGTVRVGAEAYIGTSAGHATELTPANIAVDRVIGGDETAAVSVPCGSVIDNLLSSPVRLMPGGV
jgi:hypothetical protein